MQSERALTKDEQHGHGPDGRAGAVVVAAASCGTPAAHARRPPWRAGDDERPRGLVHLDRVRLDAIPWDAGGGSRRNCRRVRGLSGRTWRCGDPDRGFPRGGDSEP